MNAILNNLSSNLVNNSGVYIAGLIALAAAVVGTMPELRPKSLDELWTWARYALQTVVPSPRGARPTLPGQTPAPTK